MLKIELGLTSFADNGDMVMPDGTQAAVSNAQRIRDIVEEIELADQLGLIYWMVNIIVLIMLYQIQ